MKIENRYSVLMTDEDSEMEENQAWPKDAKESLEQGGGVRMRNTFKESDQLRRLGEEGSRRTRNRSCGTKTRKDKRWHWRVAEQRAKKHVMPLIREDEDAEY